MTQKTAPSYERKVLHSNGAFEIIQCTWNKDSQSTLHDHYWTLGLILIQEGQFENTTDFGYCKESKVYNSQQIIQTPLGAKHQLRCLSELGKTFHVYTPKDNSDNKSNNFKNLKIEDVFKNLDLQLKPEGLHWDELTQVLNQVRDESLPANSTYFMNQLFSGVFASTLKANEIASQSRTTLATFEASPIFTAIEVQTIEKLSALIGWNSENQEGVAVPGGSAANFMALHCARHKYLPDFKRTGMSGKRFAVFASEEAHYSMQKACVSLGFGYETLVTVATDNEGRMSSTALQEAIKNQVELGVRPLMVCATAGTTVLGAFDPIADIAAVCKKSRLWLHVDGAWGGPALFAKKYRSLVDGIEKADSVSFDAHKLFGSSLTSSFFLNRHKGLLQSANDVNGGDYIFHADDQSYDRGRLSWQCGRGPDALSLWTLWKSAGTEQLGDYVDRLIDLQKEASHWVREQDRLELIHEPSFLNICVRVQPPRPDIEKTNWAQKIRTSLKDQNIAMVNFSSNKEGDFLRLIIAHPFIQLDDIKNILNASLNVHA